MGSSDKPQLENVVDDDVIHGDSFTKEKKRLRSVVWKYFDIIYCDEITKAVYK